MKNTAQKHYSVFDYTVTITRKHRYLVVNSPEFEAEEVPCASLGIDQATPDTIGEAVLQIMGRINRRLFELDQDGKSPPKPLKARGLSRQLLPSSEAARALGVSLPTLRKMVAAKLIAAEKTPGGHLRIPVDSLEKHIAEKGAA